MGQPPIRVGDVEVGVVCEGYAPLGLEDELPGQEVDWGAERSAYPWAFLDGSAWPWHVHAFALFTGEGVVMVDVGLGGFPPYRPWARHVDGNQALEAAGIRTEDVRVVVHTHLHADHAGGAVVGGVARFPNAVHHVHPADWAFFGRPERIDGYTARGPMAELERLGRLDLTEEDHVVARGVRVMHAPGHTPGHQVAVLEIGADTLLLTGDLLHLPTQIERRSAPSSHDEDPDEGARSRARLVGMAEDGGWRVAVSHFARPFGTVSEGRWNDGQGDDVRDGDG